jgi:hypothetical protein
MTATRCRFDVARSYKTTSLSVDSDVVGRLLDVARETDVYDTRHEARDDNWEQLLTLLCDHIEQQ